MLFALADPINIGGQGWAGPTNCASGSKCTYSNPWYDQCLPSREGRPFASVVNIKIYRNLWHAHYLY